MVFHAEQNNRQVNVNAIYEVNRNVNVIKMNVYSTQYSQIQI